MTRFRNPSLVVVRVLSS